MGINMDAGGIIGFVIYCIVGCLFIVFGISSFFSKKPVGFWANIKMCEVTIQGIIIRQQENYFSALEYFL